MKKAIKIIDKLKKDAERDKRRFMRNPENKKIFRDDKEKPDDFKDKTFLYIRATATDIGDRPIPPGTNYWNSPDIELYDSNNILISTNQLKRNQNYTIKVLVHNDGDMSCNSCTVDLFICDPTIGFNRMSATQIGIQTISILGHSTAVASFNFTPKAENEGHQCLFARAYSYVNGDLPNSGDQFPTTTDRHIGQQNLSIVKQGSEFEFMIAPDFLVDKAKLKLKVTQQKTPIQNFKLKSLADLKTTNKTIDSKKLLFIKNLDFPVTTRPAIYNITANNSNLISSSQPTVINNMATSRFRTGLVDITRFELIKPITANTWIYDYKAGENKVTLNIPDLSLQKNRATIFEIEMINVESNESVGGLTVIVKE